MATAYYRNAIDKENAQKYLGDNVNYQQWTPGMQTSADSYLLGGTAVLPEGLQGKRLAGLTADDTAKEIQKESWLLQKPRSQTASTKQRTLLPSSDPMSSVIGNDPEALAYYQQAQQAAKLGSRNAMETLNTRGILNSSVTGDTVTGLEQQAVTNVLPQLYAFQEQKKQQALADAYNRVEMLGYVDNDASIVLGLPVGTPSAKAKQVLFEQEMSQKNYDLNVGQALGTVNGQQTVSAQQLAAQKEQDAWMRQYQQQGFDADTAFRLAQLDLQKQELVSNNNYRNASLAASAEKTNISKYSDSATVSMKEKIDAAIDNGMTTDELLSGLKEDIADGTAKLKNYDPNYLYDYIMSKVNANYQSMSEANLDRMRTGNF